MQDTTKKVAIIFPFDSSVVDPDFMNNRQALESLDEIMADRNLVAALDSVIIIASTSPDGLPAYNKRLAQQRADALRSYIIKEYPYVNPSIVRAYANEDYWGGLIAMVEQDAGVPAREEFLNMLRNPGLSDNTKSQRMNSMNGGEVFAYLRDNFILRRLRSGEMDIKFYFPEPEPRPHPEPTPVPVPEPTPVPQPEPIVEIPVAAPQYIYPIALRTNLLYDIVGGANIGIEVPIGEHFSVAGDFVYAYTRIGKNYTFQTIQGNIEARYWFKHKRNLLTGWNVGIYGMYSNRFDLQWGGGYQGDGLWSGGITAGYAIPLSNSLNLDFSLMGGYIYSSEIREYDKPQNGHRMWTKTRYNANDFGLTGVRVNLVWLIRTIKK